MKETQIVLTDVLESSVIEQEALIKASAADSLPYKSIKSCGHGLEG